MYAMLPVNMWEMQNVNSGGSRTTDVFDNWLGLVIIPVTRLTT